MFRSDGSRYGRHLACPPSIVGASKGELSGFPASRDDEATAAGPLRPLQSPSSRLAVPARTAGNPAPVASAELAPNVSVGDDSKVRGTLFVVRASCFPRPRARPRWASATPGLRLRPPLTRPARAAPPPACGWERFWSMHYTVPARLSRPPQRCATAHATCLLGVSLEARSSPRLRELSARCAQRPFWRAPTALGCAPAARASWPAASAVTAYLSMRRRRQPISALARQRGSTCEPAMSTVRRGRGRADHAGHGINSGGRLPRRDSASSASCCWMPSPAKP